MCWSSICRPACFGGLRIINLQLHGQALRMRWLWQQHSQAIKPWQGLSLPTDHITSSIFTASTEIIIGDGMTTQFWHAHWLNGVPLKAQFPALFKHSMGARLMVGEALADNKWIRCIKPNPSIAVLTDYLHLHQSLQGVRLSPTQADCIRWRWTANGQYSASSAYLFQFQTLKLSTYPALIWRTKTPPKCQIFAYLAIQGRCLTADQLQKKGIPCNPICPLCRIHPETALHMLATCSFTRAVWDCILPRHAAAAASPEQSERCLESWWCKITAPQSMTEATKTNCIVIATWWKI